MQKHLVVVDFDETKTVDFVHVDHGFQIEAGHTPLISEKKKGKIAKLIRSTFITLRC